MSQAFCTQCINICKLTQNTVLYSYPKYPYKVKKVSPFS